MSSDIVIAKRASPTFIAGLECASCGVVCLRTGRQQKYCRDCSEKKSIENKMKWSNANSKNRDTKLRSAISDHGIEISEASRATLMNWHRPINLAWQVFFSFPFSWKASKNHIFAMRPQGHLALRAEAKEWRGALTLRVKAAMRDQPIVRNKIWIDIYIQKPNHRGDAANFVDILCDAIKDGIGIDDRWFSIRRLDWEIVKKDPLIFIAIGQECAADSQACSSCGRILPFSEFQKNRAALHGHSRNCKDCCSTQGGLA